MNDIVPVPEVSKKTKLFLKKIRGLDEKRYASLGGINPTFLGESVVMLDEHSTLEKESKKYTYDEVLGCMRDACTLTAAYGIPKDSDLETLIPRHE